MQPEHIEERICQPDFATGLSVANDHRKNPGRKTAGPPDLEGSDEPFPADWTRQERIFLSGLKD